MPTTVNMNHEVMGDILLKLESMYNDKLSKTSVVRICQKKYGKCHFNPFIHEVMTSIGHSINTQSGFFFQYLIRKYLEAVKIIDSDEPRYEFMEESKGTYSSLGINVATMQAEVQNRNIPLVFKDKTTDVVYFIQVCKDDYFEGDSRSIFINRFMSISDSLSRKYSNLSSFILFVEEEEKEKFGVLDAKHIMTGKKFFETFLDCSIDEFYTLLTNCKKTMRLDKRYLDCYKWINQFIGYADEVGSEKAGILMLKSYTAKNRSKFGM